MGKLDAFVLVVLTVAGFGFILSYLTEDSLTNYKLFRDDDR